MELSSEESFFLAGLLGCVVLVMLAGGLFAAGALLSRLELARLERLPAGSAPGWSLVSALYTGTLGLAVLLFYAAFPLMLGVSAVFGYGVVRLTWALFSSARFISLGGVAVFLVILVGAVMGVLAAALGVFAPPRPASNARRLRPEEAPELFAMLGEAAEVARTRMPDAVEVAFDASLHVREEGSSLRVLLGRGARTLHLGVAGIEGMTVTELKAVLAHEFGHLSAGDTRLLTVIAGAGIRAQVIAENYESMGTLGAINPVYWFVVAYGRALRRITNGMGRRQEFLADLSAARRFGGAAFASALTRFAANAALFARYASSVAVSMRQLGCNVTDLRGPLREISARMSEVTRRELEREAASDAPEDRTHPPLARRIVFVQAIEGTAAKDARQADVLFPPELGLHDELTRTLVSQIDAALEATSELPAASVSLPLEEERTIAAEIGLLGDDLEALGNDASSDGLARVEQRVSAIMAHADKAPRLGLELQRLLARRYATMCRWSEAETSIRRAMDFAQRMPESAPLLLELKAELEAIQNAAPRPESAAIHEPHVEPAFDSPARPEVAGEAEPVALEQKFRCDACGSVSPHEAVQRRNACPWCGADAVQLRRVL